MTGTRLEAFVSGQVQGVGFRDFVRRQAQSLRLTGRAANLADGRVQVIAQGPRDACEQLLAALRGDRTPGYVDGIDVAWAEPRDGVIGFVTR